MFKCKCGIADKKLKQQRVVTEARKVEYIYKIRIEKIGIKDDMPAIVDSYDKTVETSHGTEIVSETIYCPKCIPKEIEPKIIGEVTRVIMLKTVRQREGGRDKRRYR